MVSMMYDYELWGRVPRPQDVATGRIGDSFILLPRILCCWGSFARAFLLRRLRFLHDDTPFRCRELKSNKNKVVRTLDSGASIITRALRKGLCRVELPWPI
jgi:hypothetical protein